MKVFAVVLFAILCLFPILNFSQTIPIEDDTNIWTETSVAVPLIKSKDKDGNEFDRLTLSVTGTLRFGRDVSYLTDRRIAAGLSYRLNKYVSFSSEYVYRNHQPFRGRNDFEHRIRPSITLEKKWSKISIADRNMFEYRFRNSRSDSLRYRNRFRFNYAIKKNDKEIITPFVSTEPFYDFQENRWTRNELFIGFGKKFTENLSADFFYLHVNDVGNPKTINGFGANLKFRIE